jgi:hypothetical protein
MVTTAFSWDTATYKTRHLLISLLKPVSRSSDQSTPFFTFIPRSANRALEIWTKVFAIFSKSMLNRKFFGRNLFSLYSFHLLTLFQIHLHCQARTAQTPKHSKRPVNYCRSNRESQRYYARAHSGRG